MTQEILIPDIGDFKDVPVIEIPVAVGDVVTVDDPILMLESDKATLDIPSPAAGKIIEILVSVGDPVSQGSLVMRFESATQVSVQTEAIAASLTPPDQTADHADLVVIGAGPGGYTAAFHAADLGRNVTLIDSRATLGGVCLNVGCIPSKALLHLAQIRSEALKAPDHGLGIACTDIDLDKVRDFKDSVVDRLTTGLAGLAKRRKVQIIQGSATFISDKSLCIKTQQGETELSFDQAIIAVGSSPVKLPFLPDDPRIIDSTGALELEDVPNRLLIIGGGIIGLEMAQVYGALGSTIDIVEMADQIIPNADADIVKPLAKQLNDRYSILTRTKITQVCADTELTATFEGPDGSHSKKYDRILVAVGRTPNGNHVAPQNAGIEVTAPGFIPVSPQMRTSQHNIFAIGDVVGQPMLAHKATHEAKVAVQAACGEKVAFEPACIPSVAYTDPEIAWVGVTESEATFLGQEYKIGKFRWAASGRALSLGRDEGLTKIIIDQETEKVIGAGIAGPQAGDLIVEAGIAIEMGATAEDIASTIHPHPTLSETISFAAEDFLGTLVDN